MNRRRSMQLDIPRNYEPRVKRAKKKDNSTFKKYCSRHLKETAVTGVVPVLKSDGWCRKLVKILILMFGLAGFLFQTHEFLVLFWQHSTVAYIGNMNRMKKPAFTICDENLLRRRFVCNNTEWCTSYDAFTFCTVLFKQYCKDPNDIYQMDPGIITIYPDEFFDIEFTKEGGFNISSAVLQCEWFSNELNILNRSYTTSCGTPQFTRGLNVERLPGACYTFNSDFDGVFQEVKNLNRDTVLKLNLRWWSSDEINVVPITNLVTPTFRHYYIAFHHPAELSNPFREGFKVQERKHYKVQVTEVDYIRMPPPYTTKCYDYIKDWIKNEGTGPLTREYCQSNCELDGNFEGFGCVPRYVDYPHARNLCTVAQPYDMKVNTRIQTCIAECRDACYETRYLAESEVAAEISSDSAKERFGTPNAVTLEVHFDTLRSKIIEDKPKFESVELFSYIGGYLGMWLGWSLLAILDFIEIIFMICTYPFKQKSKQSRVPARKPFVKDDHFY